MTIKPNKILLIAGYLLRRAAGGGNAIDRNPLARLGSTCPASGRGELRCKAGLFLTAFAWGLLISPVWSQEVAAPEADREIKKADVLDWVDGLNASSRARRTESEKKLIEAGPDVLKWLPESGDRLSIETVERLDRIREKLTKIRTKNESKLEFSQIRLGKISNLGEALEAISRDSGVEFEHDADESIAVSPIPTPLPFWHALDFVLDAAKLDINFYGGDENTLKLIARAKGRPSRVDSAAYAGVYRIEPTAVTARRNLNQPDLSGLNVAVKISWQPTTTPIGLIIPVPQLSGRLSDSSRLKPQTTSDKIDVATNSDLAMSEFYLPMQLPADQPKTIKSLSGVVRAMLPGKRQTFELALSETAASKTIDAMTVTVEAVRKNGPLHEIRVGVELKNADRSLESHRQWIFENAVHVLRKDGSRADHLGYETYRQTSSGVGIGYLFDLGDTVGESTLIYKSPTAVIQNEVSFVIQDIPMP
ncbi:hypothetical protein [Rubripirellula obstinata]|nr:hypothetical protein [Rubripirellula obstinata]